MRLSGVEANKTEKEEIKTPTEIFPIVPEKVSRLVKIR
jgi:hypothetical protein